MLLTNTGVKKAKKISLFNPGVVKDLARSASIKRINDNWKDDNARVTHPECRDIVLWTRPDLEPGEWEWCYSERDEMWLKEWCYKSTAQVCKYKNREIRRYWIHSGYLPPAQEKVGKFRYIGVNL